ncbi:MAG: hypothetical protein SFY92_00755 [Verrucomicrobiae bacterium]|nr:hypothetical protein [Verrucomicrobiae bacterium]
MNCPDGYFIKDMLVWGDPPQWVSRGFLFEGPDRSNAGDAGLAKFERAVCNQLNSLSVKWRIQGQFMPDSDYRKEILAYNVQTKAMPDGWPKKNREERAARAWNNVRNRKHRREVMRVYFSRPIKNSPPAGLSKNDIRKFWEDIIDELHSEFELLQSSLMNRFRPTGSSLLPMDDIDHFKHLSYFLRPSLHTRFNLDISNQFQPGESICRNCLNSEMQGGLRHRPAFGFAWDGFYQNILVLSRLPDVTEETSALQYTHTDLLDYNITVNVYPMDIRKAKRKEQAIMNDLKTSYASKQDEDLLTEFNMRKQRLENISLGVTTPHEIDYIFRLWAASPDELARNTARLEDIIERIPGARYHRPLTFATSRKLFFQSWPGWIYGTYTDHKKYSEDKVLARIMPLSSSFSGHLDQAEAFYDSNHNALAGIRTDINGQPQHAVLLGMSGAGKSMLMFDLLSQILPFLHYTAIIEEGNSYGPLVKACMGQTIFLQADGELTINYLDTHGLPLNFSHIETASAIAARMAGHVSDEDKQYLKKSLITSYITRLYTRTFQNWVKYRPDKADYFARMTMAISRIQRILKKDDATTTFVEAFAYARENEASLELHKVIESYSGEDVARFYKTPTTQILVRNLAYAFLTPEEMPRHSTLVEAMKMTPMSNHDARFVRDIATVLETWTADRGSNGKLFDGVTNIKLTQALTHFELGDLRANSELKDLAGFLIAMFVRQHIISLPRSLRKAVIFEEVARLLDIPGGEEFVKETYAQMRKFRAWVCSIVQQYAQFKQSRIRPIVFGNAKMLLLQKQNDRDDLEDISQVFGLPEATKNEIMEYDLPEHIDYAYSKFTYYHLDAQRPICGTMINVVSEATRKIVKDYWTKQEKTNIRPEDLMGREAA